MPNLPVTYSVTCTKALLAEVIPQFNIEKATGCEFWCQGLNESYKVATANKNYLLRIYRYQWRTLEEIQFELEALLHLKQNNANIAYPISTNEGDYIVNVAAPEGQRYAILTSYIEGDEADLSVPENLTLYAQHMASLHQKSTLFQSDKQRFQLNVQHLITEPLQRIQPFLAQQSDDWLFINEYANTLAKQLQDALDNSLDSGFCHGDLHGGNAHLLNNQITSFDFDCCGFGLRIYDLAILKWSAKLSNKPESVWQTFLQSYQQVRPLADSDVELIDLLVSVRHIWLIGLHIDIAVAKGWLNKKYFDHKIAFLRSEKALNKL